MLAISETTREALGAYAKPQFAARIRAPLTKRYAAILTRFPEQTRFVIIDNLLARADAWGLKDQSAVLAFCEFMLKIAPNFDEDPEIRGLLECANGKTGPTRDIALKDMPEKASEGAWERARQQRSNLPLFIPPELIGAPSLDQTVAALPLLLFDRPMAQSARTAVEQSLPVVTALNMRGLTDAPLVICVCRAIWGPDFLQLPWVNIVAREHLPPKLVLAAFRLRLAQDFGRYV
jgi:hypothetical protein